MGRGTVVSGKSSWVGAGGSRRRLGTGRAWGMALGVWAGCVLGAVPVEAFVFDMWRSGMVADEIMQVARRHKVPLVPIVVPLDKPEGWMELRDDEGNRLPMPPRAVQAGKLGPLEKEAKGEAVVRGAGNSPVTEVQTGKPGLWPGEGPVPVPALPNLAQPAKAPREGQAPAVSGPAQAAASVASPAAAVAAPSEVVSAPQGVPAQGGPAPGAADPGAPAPASAVPAPAVSGPAQAAASVASPAADVAAPSEVVSAPQGVPAQGGPGPKAPVSGGPAPLPAVSGAGDGVVGTKVGNPGPSTGVGEAAVVPAVASEVVLLDPKEHILFRYKVGLNPAVTLYLTPISRKLYAVEVHWVGMEETSRKTIEREVWSIMRERHGEPEKVVVERLAGLPVSPRDWIWWGDSGQGGDAAILQSHVSAGSVHVFYLNNPLLRLAVDERNQLLKKHIVMWMAATDPPDQPKDQKKRVAKKPERKPIEVKVKSMSGTSNVEGKEFGGEARSRGKSFSTRRPSGR